MHGTVSKNADLFGTFLPSHTKFSQKNMSTDCPPAPRLQSRSEAAKILTCGKLAQTCPKIIFFDPPGGKLAQSVIYCLP